MHNFNYTAGNFAAGISGRLGFEIICMAVDDHGTPYNILNGKAFVVEGAPGVSFISKKWREVTGVEGMELVGRIVMVSCVSKLIGAVSVLMDMEGIEVGGAGGVFVGKVEDLSFHQYALVGCFIEFYKAA